MLAPVRAEPRREQAAAVASRRAAAGLRLFPPRRPHRQGRRLRDLPRAHRPDAADLSGHRRSRWNSASIAIATRRRTCGRTIHHRHGLEARRRRARAWRAIGEAERHPRRRSSTIATCATDDRPHRISILPRSGAGSPAPAASGSGQAWRRSSTTAAFARWLEAEFPAAAAIMPSRGRREFLKLMGASLLLAGLAGCSEERSDLALPYVNQPEDDHARRAALLRHGGLLRRLCAAGAGDDLRGPADQARRQSRPSGDRRPQRRLHAGRRAAALRSRPLAGAGASRPCRAPGPRSSAPSADMRRDWAANKGKGCACCSAT